MTLADVDSLTFEFWSGGNYRGAERGRFADRWSGIATRSQEVMAVVRGPWRRGGFWTLNDHAHVEARGDWATLQSAAVVYTRKLPDTLWGAYHAPLIGDLSASEGSGPWERSYYVSTRPGLVSKPAVMLLDDLTPDGKERKLVHGECGVADGSLVNVYRLNEKCGWKSRLADFDRMVREHEFTHDSSLNKCFQAIASGFPFSGHLAELEGIVRDNEGDAKNDANEIWKRLIPALEKARESKQSDQRFRQTLWYYERPRGPWSRGTIDLPGHSGTDGCPGI
ncbi:MAG: hypothetical protein OXG18_07875 [Gemmatimonadetes bacterium]|nr:hypothetical protein [Gemmatimonadota bacterium]